MAYRELCQLVTAFGEEVEVRGHKTREITNVAVTIRMDILGRKIADPDVMWLVDRILESGVGVLSEAYQMAYFPGDDLFALEQQGELDNKLGIN